MNMHKLLFAALPLLASPLLAQGFPEIEPNDDYTTATPLVPGTQGEGDIDLSGDYDYFSFTLTANADVKVWLNPGRGASIEDSDITLFDTDGTTELLFNEDADNPFHYLSELVAGDLAPGTYFVRVRSSDFYDPLGIGSYTIDLVTAAPGTYATAVPPATAGPGEAAENNDPRPAYGSGIAGVTPLDTDNLGNISAAAGTSSYTGTGDYDFYEINVPTPGLLIATTDFAGVPAPAMLDTVLHLADSTLTRIAVHDDINFPANALSRLVYNITTPGTYYVAVSGWDAGNYQLRISFGPPVPAGQASATVQAGGCGPTLGLRETPVGPAVITETPCLGSAFFVDGAAMPANAPLVHIIGILPLGTPFDLGPYGATGCQVEVDPLDQTFALADAGGEDYWQLNSPVSVAFIGLPIEQQLAVLDPAANALGIAVSNRVSSVFGIDN